MGKRPPSTACKALRTLLSHHQMRLEGKCEEQIQASTTMQVKESAGKSTTSVTNLYCNNPQLHRTAAYQMQYSKVPKQCSSPCNMPHTEVRLCRVNSSRETRRATAAAARACDAPSLPPPTAPANIQFSDEHSVKSAAKPGDMYLVSMLCLGFNALLCWMHGAKSMQGSTSKGGRSGGE